MPRCPEDSRWGKRNAYRLLQAAQLFERMAITSSPMARRGGRIRHDVFQDNTQQHTATNDQAGEVWDIWSRRWKWSVQSSITWLYICIHLCCICIIYLAQSGACVTHGLHAGCLLQCVGSAKLQDVLMQCVFGSRKSKAWRPVLQVFKDHQRSLFWLDASTRALCFQAPIISDTELQCLHLICETSGFNSCSFTKSTRWPRWPCLENWNSSCEAHPHQWTEPTHLQAFWPISIWRPSKSCFALLQYASIIRYNKLQ